MATCNDCSAIEPDKRGAAGHPHLVSLGEVRSMEAARKARARSCSSARVAIRSGSTPTTSVTKRGLAPRAARAGAHQGLMRA